MAPKKNTGPMLFCEWVIGGPLPGARRSLQPKLKPKAAPKPIPPRDVIRVEVTTDDEKEEDTLKITFPRSGKAAPPALEEKVADAVVKKVRFQEEKKNGAKKSALKQPKSDESDSSATLAESSSDGESSKDETNKEDDKGQASSEESESDGEPHPTCKCSRCVKRRKKNGKQNKAKDSESEESASEDEKVKHKDNKKGGKKQQQQQDAQKRTKDQQKGKKKDNSDADDEASESGKETTDDEKEANDKKPAETKADKKKAAAEKKKEESKKGESSKSAEDKNKDASKNNEPFSSSPFSYPEAFPGPHARRPNLIAPIRAQVVQTEDVVETPNDPPPNAFYDAAANIMRVYYGPVYGNHNPAQRALYPQRDHAGRPLPVGMPHPTQNPYYYGFQNVPGYDANGMPPPEWNGAPFGQPPGFPPFVTNPMFQPQKNDAAATGGGNKGAFSKGSPAAAPSVSQADDKAGRSNVLPTSKIDEKKTTSPYYTPSETAVKLRNESSHHASPAKSAAAAPDNTTPSTWETTAPAQGTWGEDSTNDANAWPTDNTNTADGNNTWETNNNDDDNGGNNGWDAAPSGGSGSGSGGDAVGWDNTPVAPTTEDPPPPPGGGVSNNVMPGSWDAIPTAPPAAWGDPSAAQSTNGQADCW